MPARLNPINVNPPLCARSALRLIVSLCVLKQRQFSKLDFDDQPRKKDGFKSSDCAQHDKAG